MGQTRGGEHSVRELCEGQILLVEARCPENQKVPIPMFKAKAMSESCSAKTHDRVIATDHCRGFPTATDA